jgi:predicted alpha/beta-fold hydrolase
MLHGHAWTLFPHLLGLLRPPVATPSVAWDARIDDPRMGPVRLTGRLHDTPGADAIAVVVHGLGGSADSAYAVRTAAAAARAGMAALRLNLRGADRGGDDFYHAGLTADLDAALASDALARYRRVFAIGFSLGGHVVLRWALEAPARVRAVAAICAPLDLAASCAHIDAPINLGYRLHLLRGLFEIYRAVAARGRAVPTPPAIVRRIRTIRAWDALTVAPRFGFAGADDYYRRTSAGPALDRLEVPALYVGADGDPMVSARDVRGWLARASRALRACWYRGGHVGYPAGVDLGLGGAPGVERQILRWLAER